MMELTMLVDNAFVWELYSTFTAQLVSNQGFLLLNSFSTLKFALIFRLNGYVFIIMVFLEVVMLKHKTTIGTNLPSLAPLGFQMALCLGLRFRYFTTEMTYLFADVFAVMFDMLGHLVPIYKHNF